MIYVYGPSWTAEDKAGFTKIIGFLGVDPAHLRFVDLSYEDPDILNRDFIICVEKAYKPVAQAFVAAGIFKHGQLLGYDVVDPATKFLMFHLPYTITQIFTNDEAKQIVWDKLVAFAGHWKEFHVDQVIDSITSEPEPAAVVQNPAQAEVIAQPQSDPGQPFNDSLDALDASLPENKQTTVQQSEVVSSPVDPASSLLISIDVNALMAKIDQALDLSDPAIGRSLGLSEKIELSTPSGKIIIYPGGTKLGKEANTAHLTLKDTLALIKACAVFDASKITFHMKQDAVQLSS